MKARERLQYFLGAIPLVMLASITLTFALSGLSPRPTLMESGVSDPYILSRNPTRGATLLNVAGTGTRIIAEPADIGADGDRSPEPDEATLFGIVAAEWSGLYVRGAEGQPIPRLVFDKVDGTKLILEADRDFDGKTPVFALNGTRARLNVRFAVNLAVKDRGIGETARGLGEIELGLTEEGRRKLAQAGIPTPIPAAIERVTATTNTLFLNAAISETDGTGLTTLDPINEWYRSRFALYFPGSRDEAYWRTYAPLLQIETAAARNRAILARTAGEEAQNAGRGVFPQGFRFKVDSKRMLRRGADAEWMPFVIKGVNLGSSLPGTSFTEFPRDEALYWHWFSLMRDMNLNAIRVYTLFPPEFYRALVAFNRANPGRELCLLQEIWPDEAPPGGNLLDPGYTEAFYREIDYTLTALHGAGTVPQRTGRASGEYDADASPWTAAYLVGREIEPDEVLATDSLNRGYRYEGRWFSVPRGSPTESWLAAACDRVASVETDGWGETRPVSAVNWPPLDPIPHWVEWRDPWLGGRAPANDKAEVNLDRIEVSPDFGPGFFGSWHIYPNYPDFMVATPWYAKYRDEAGEFRYGGYLRELRMFNGRYPTLLAEFGLSTSLGIAHVAPDGLDHGGISEADQGPALARMAKAALAEGFMGTVIFEWADEWAKQTWSTAPFMIPYAGHQAWHNALDPEQYYGIVAMESDSGGEPARTAGGKAFTALRAAGNEEFLTLTITKTGGWAGLTGTLAVGFDVLDPASGLRALETNPESGALPRSGRPDITRGYEFLLEVSLTQSAQTDSEAVPSVSARLLAADTCNIGKNRFAMTDAQPSRFEEIRILVNRETVDSLGRRSGTRESDRSALVSGDRGVGIRDETLTAKIPWGLLNVADPSRALVIDDPDAYAQWPDNDTLKVKRADRIVMQGEFRGDLGKEPLEDWFPRAGDGFADTWAYEFRPWTAPQWRARAKPAVDVLTAYFGTY